MTRILIICVGKMKERFYADAAAEYIKRLGAFCRLEVCEIPEAKLSGNPAEAEISRAMELEAAAILERIPKGAFTAAMCVEGKAMSSEELAELLTRTSAEARWGSVFIIGGSNGLHNSAKKFADARISMSRMTFPHHLARVMLLEQIYRGFTINQGSKYHK